MSVSKSDITKGPSGNVSVSVNKKSQSLEHETEQSIDGFLAINTLTRITTNPTAVEPELETNRTSTSETNTNTNTNTLNNNTSPSCLSLFKMNSSTLE